jgi:hypothetical protein
MYISVLAFDLVRRIQGYLSCPWESVSTPENHPLGCVQQEVSSPLLRPSWYHLCYCFLVFFFFAVLLASAFFFFFGILASGKFVKE